MVARRRRPRPLPAWLAGLRRAGLLQDPVLVLGDAELARRLARRGLRVQGTLPGRSAPPTFATIIDLGWAAGRPPGRRRAAVRDLVDVVVPNGVLHVLVRRDAHALHAPGPRWHLLTVHDVHDAWLATFVHAPTVRLRGADRAVRNFTDVGAFGSLGLGASADPYGA